MTNAKHAEIMTAIQTLKAVTGSQWLAFMKKDEDKLPYLIADVAGRMDSAVRTLCPPGYEIDR